MEKTLQPNIACPLCGKVYTAKSLLTKHLVGYHKLSNQEISEIKMKLNFEGITLPGEAKGKASRDKTCLEKFGVVNPFQSEEKKEKIRQTSLERYGTEHTTQSKEVKDKMKETCLKKYGVEFSTQTQQMKDNSMKAKLDKYGNPFYRNDEQIKKTNLERYGVEYGLASAEVQKKISKTCLKRYGVTRPCANLQVYERVKSSSYYSKPYVLPSGKTILLQGYENRALDILLKQYKEEDILIGRDISKELGNFVFIDENGNNRTYIPDIYVKPLRLIIEVKSPYTYEKQEAINNLKKQSVLSKGINFKFYIFEPDPNKCVLILD